VAQARASRSRALHQQWKVNLFDAPAEHSVSSLALYPTMTVGTCRRVGRRFEMTHSNLRVEGPL